MELHKNLGLVELTMAICDIESVSGNESELADQLEQLLSAAPHLKIIRDGNAVIAKTELGLKSRVIIAGHLDTVPVANNLPTQLHHFEREQTIIGRGTVDMKGGVAVMLKLALEITNPINDITWIFYDNEEVAADLNGLGRIQRNHPELMRGDFAVLCEPTNALVEGGCNGTMRIELHTNGVKAHSARPWMGENAIHKLERALGILNSYKPKTISVEGLDFRESLNAVLVRGGIATNVIPDQAVLTINYRFAPDKDAAQAKAHLEEVFSEFEIRVTDMATGARPGLNTPIAQAFLKSVGGDPKPKYGWTDVARFSAAGIPAVNYGPGDPSLAHADNENVPVGQLFDCEIGLRGWLTP